jgi:hypothetical protein
MKNTIINESNKNELEKLFTSFLNKHSWSDEVKTACTYSFFHSINLINSNLVHESDFNNEYHFDNNTAKCRSRTIDEAIEVIRNCELVAPNVRRIRVDSAVGALLELK